jgi:hypothetical protein
MAKTVEAVINGTAYHMPANYKASVEIARTVGDPLKLAVAANQNRGSVSMSIEDVVNIIAIGCKHAGCSLPAESIGEAVVEAGVMNYLKIVGDYLLAICTGAGDGGPTPKKAGARK